MFINKIIETFVAKQFEDDFVQNQTKTNNKKESLYKQAVLFAPTF